MIDSTLLPLIFNINQRHIHNLSKKKKLTTKIKYFEFSFNANFNQKEKTKEIAIKKIYIVVMHEIKYFTI